LRSAVRTLTAACGSGTRSERVAREEPRERIGDERRPLDVQKVARVGQVEGLGTPKTPRKKVSTAAAASPAR
jgi:hypothetical protein